MLPGKKIEIHKYCKNFSTLVNYINGPCSLVESNFDFCCMARPCGFILCEALVLESLNR